MEEQYVAIQFWLGEPSGRVFGPFDAYVEAENFCQEAMDMDSEMSYEVATLYSPERLEDTVEDYA